MANFDTLNNRKSELIRKATEGSVFVQDLSAPVLESITSGSTAELTLPEDLVKRDLGWLTEDGVAFSGEVAESAINSWGATEPTRREVTSDTTTISVTAQETNLVTVGLYTGNDIEALRSAVDPTTGELVVTKPPRPRLRHFRVFALAVDSYEGEDVYIGRYVPRATLSRSPEQSFTSGDTALTWGLTFTSSLDREAGYSERFFFGGPGWKAMLDEMGFTVEEGNEPTP